MAPGAGLSVAPGVYFEQTRYNAFNVYRRELAPGTVSLTGDRAQGDDSKHWAYSRGPLDDARYQIFRLKSLWIQIRFFVVVPI